VKNQGLLEHRNSLCKGLEDCEIWLQKNPNVALTFCKKDNSDLWISQQTFPQDLSYPSMF